jgi:predicted AAA+ superfamily ATPase
MRSDADIFDLVRIPPELDELLRSSNPWWIGKPGRVLPPYRRRAFETIRHRLESGLAPAVLLRGSRQVGKTTLQEQIIDHFVRERGIDPRRVLRVQFDELPSLAGLKEPILAIVRWFENRILGRTLNETAHDGQPAFLFFDEAQNLPHWAPQIKSLVDHHTVRVLVTGSSALRIELGRDSLAGRVTTVELGTLLLREIAALRFGEELPSLLGDNGIDRLRERSFWDALVELGASRAEARDRAFRLFSRFGGYPFAHARPDASWDAVKDHLNETVIRRVIEHDLRVGDRGRRRDAVLLEEVFRTACRYAGQAPAMRRLVQNVTSSHSANVGEQRVRSYLRFLESALLVRLIDPLEIRVKKRKGSAKICIVDHALRASWLAESIPLAPDEIEASPQLADLAGRIAESVLGAFLGGIPHLGVHHFPERETEPEIDFVLTVGEHRIPVEVKYRQRIDPARDTLGLRSFLERTAYNAPFGILVTLHDEAPNADPRIVTLPLRSLLLAR